MPSRTCTCHTEGCENADHPIDVETDYPDADTGDLLTVSQVVCGVCGAEIEDVAPPLDQPLQETPE